MPGARSAADVGMGTGAIVIGLAAIVIGDVLMGRLRSSGDKLTSAVVGSGIAFCNPRSGSWENGHECQRYEAAFRSDRGGCPLCPCRW